MAKAKRNTSGLIPFVKGQPPANPAGRPRKTIRLFLDECKKLGIVEPTKDDIVSMIKFLFGLTEAELKTRASDKDEPMGLRLLAMKVLESKEAGIGVLEFLLARSIGKVTEEQNHTGGIQITFVDSTSKE